MRNIRNLLLFVALFSFLACQGPYDKPEKKPVKIGLAAKRAKKIQQEKDKEKGEVQKAEDMVTLDNKGVGPIDHVDIPDEINQDMAAAGKETFNTMCIACHKLKQRFVGPALSDVLSFRSPEWVMNMILDPGKMLEEDPVAKQMLEEYGAPMANLGLSKEQARELVEFFRTTKE